MALFGYSSITGEKLRMTVRIENFSMRVCKETFESPEYGIESFPDAKFSLIVEFMDGAADYDDYVVVRLSRNVAYNYDDGYDEHQQQLVKARVSVVDFVGFQSLTEVTKIYFDKAYTDSREVLSVSKGQLLSSYKGLNKLRFLPDDTLTLVCDLDVYREISESFESREEFENSREAAESSSTVQYFARSGLASKEFEFLRRFRKFSTCSCKERLVSEEFRREGSVWSLVVYDCQDVFDIKLRRNNPFHEGQFVEVKLALLGRLGSLFSLKGSKKAYFHGYRDEETPILSIDKRNLSGWGRLKKLLWMPDDSLTLQCHITAYEEGVSTFEQQKDFLSSFDQNGYWWKWLLFSLMIVYFLLSIVFATALATVRYTVMSLIFLVSLLVKYVLPLAIKVLRITATCVIYFKRWWNKREEEKRRKSKEERQNRRQSNRSHHTGKEVDIYQKHQKQCTAYYPNQIQRVQAYYCFYDRYGRKNYYCYEY